MSSPNRIAVLDGLKGLAILGIIIFHVATVIEFSWPPIWSSVFYAGRQGIVLFFIISGYSIRSFSLPHYFEKPSSSNKLKYLLSRFFRIAPLYYFILLTSVILLRLSFPLGITSTEEINISNILIHLAFLHSLSPKYFLSLVSVAWILGLEVYFYLISIALYRIRNYKTHLLLLSASASISIFSPLLLPYLWPTVFRGGTIVWLENSPLVYFAFFYAGYLVAEFRRLFIWIESKLRPSAGDIFFAVSATLFVFLIISKHLIIANFLLIPLFISIFLPSRFINRIFSSRFFTVTGVYSYALFLAHTIAFRGYLPYFNSLKLIVPLIILFPAYLLIVYISSLAAAFLLHRWIEIPGISIGKKILNKL